MRVRVRIRWPPVMLVSRGRADTGRDLLSCMHWWLPASQQCIRHRSVNMCMHDRLRLVLLQYLGGQMSSVQLGSHACRHVHSYFCASVTTQNSCIARAQLPIRGSSVLPMLVAVMAGLWNSSSKAPGGRAVVTCSLGPMPPSPAAGCATPQQVPPKHSPPRSSLALKLFISPWSLCRYSVHRHSSRM